jgi:hypothetical protein
LSGGPRDLGLLVRLTDRLGKVMVVEVLGLCVRDVVLVVGVGVFGSFGMVCGVHWGIRVSLRALTFGALGHRVNMCWWSLVCGVCVVHPSPTFREVVFAEVEGEAVGRRHPHFDWDARA